MKIKHFIILGIIIMMIVPIVLENKKTVEEPQNEIKTITYNEEEKKIISDFYTEGFLSKYKSILDLSNEPKSVFYDNYRLVDEENSINDSDFIEFLNNYKNKKNAYLRMIMYTIEGDPIVYDIIYNSKKGTVKILTDFSRDKFAIHDEDTLTVTTYKKVEEKDSKLIAYNNVTKNEYDDYFVIGYINTK